MKFLRNFIFRASCAMAIGVLLIEYREEIVRWIVITIGVLFFLAGIIALVGYYTASAAAQQVSDEVETSASGTSNTLQLTPFVAVGSIILGAVLALFCPHCSSSAPSISMPTSLPSPRWSRWDCFIGSCPPFFSSLGWWPSPIRRLWLRRPFSSWDGACCSMG